MILPLSASKISKYLTCERFFLDRYIRKIVDTTPEGAALEGINRHLFFEQVLKNEPVTMEYPELRGYAEKIKSLEGVKHVELSLCVDSEFILREWDDENAFVRGRIDLLIETDEIKILDWKFTKQAGLTEAEKYRLEMDIFAFLAFVRFPAHDRIYSELHWLGESKAEPTVWEYNRKKDFERIRKMLVGYYRSIKADLKANNWPVRHSGLCRGWCANTSCPAWEPKKETKG